VYLTLPSGCLCSSRSRFTPMSSIDLLRFLSKPAKLAPALLRAEVFVCTSADPTLLQASIAPLFEASYLVPCEPKPQSLSLRQSHTPGSLDPIRYTSTAILLYSLPRLSQSKSPTFRGQSSSGPSAEDPPNVPFVRRSVPTPTHCSWLGQHLPGADSPVGLLSQANAPGLV
jgi:hypothetical protein